MRVRKKVFIIIFIFILLFLLILILYIKNSILESYKQLEYKRARSHMQRVKNEYDYIIQNLNKFLLDWAIWDDTYKFIENCNKKYIESNLQIETFTNAEINFFIFFNNKSEIIYGKFVDLSKQKEIPLPSELIEKTKNLKNQSGIILLNNKDVFLISSHNILDSKKIKKTNGSIVIGYKLTDKKINEINKKLQIKIKKFFISNLNNSNDNFLIVDNNNKNIIGYIYTKTLDNKYIITQISMDKNILSLGKQKSFEILFALMIILFFTSGIFIFTLDKIVLTKIEKLSSNVIDITNFNLFNNRLDINGKDEIEKLKISINKMLDKITDSINNYEILYEETPSLNILIDSNNNIINVNNSFLDIIKYEKKYVIGKSVYDFIANNSTAKFKIIENNISKNKKIKNIEIDILDKDLNVHTLLINSTEISLKNNKQKIRLITGIDITDRKKAEKKLAKFASLDMMTGAYNRREGLNKLKKIIKISKEKNLIFTICFVDINNLKIVNDTFGHIQGDNLVIDTCKIIKKCIRNTDIIARLGGDEFLIIFPEVNIKNAMKIFKRIEKEIDLFNNTNYRPYKISISKGFAQFDRSMNAKKLIELADKRMYTNKKIKKLYDEVRQI
ncbi:diguanylate cyclase [Caminicella sporogenes]|uniref:diguanylate cyclase n=1 Tax=Caminicella sporogenes TaxID=166485 RepID=UPI0025410B56|nr:diguanylate cyclase [Caminicella sporogenes]WIF95639.1 diguanylate cyclase [Caminicella sporogenes]